MNTVALIKDRNGIKETLEEGLELLGGFGALKSPVLIKPNICTMKDGTGHSVTDINVVKALVHLILEVDDNLSIKIVESDSQSKNAEDAFDKFGYKEYCSEMRNLGFDISTLNLSRVPLAKIDFEGQYFKNPELPEILASPHYFISVAVAKTHYLSYITGALKNLFGVLPRKDMSFYHSRIHDVITDLARIIKPELNIVDARVGIEDWNGPTTHNIGAFILGKHPVSVDATMVLMMGLDPLEVRHLVQCSNHDLGNIHPVVVGESIETVKEKFNSPS
ncbi:MAG: DUF362 domain-containing protein [Candidatus Thorarchaeota archaeon]